MDQCTPAPPTARVAAMKIVSTTTRTMQRLVQRLDPEVELSRPARMRQALFDWHRSHGENVSRSCRHFGISRPTFYRWQRRYVAGRPQTLENRSCQTRGIRLFVLPPRSPKLNGCVERTNRTWREEFYECTPAAGTVAALRAAAREWETVYNTVRPHQALGYQTPAAWLKAWRATNHPETPSTERRV
jgi:transposase InsO family protein